MTLVVKFIAIVISLLFISFLIVMIRKDRLDLKYTLLWLLAGLLMLVVSVFPEILTWLATITGISTPINALFFYAIIFLLIIIVALTSIVSGLRDKIYKLAQNIAILDKRYKDLEKKVNSIDNKKI